MRWRNFTALGQSGKIRKRSERKSDIRGTGKRNLQIARKKLTSIINVNFNGDDYFVLLTYGMEVSLEEARKLLANFLLRLKRYRKKNGFSELKYVAVTETQGKNGRVHHHIVMSGFEGLSMKEGLEILLENGGMAQF